MTRKVQAFSLQEILLEHACVRSGEFKSSYPHQSKRDVPNGASLLLYRRKWGKSSYAHATRAFRRFKSALAASGKVVTTRHKTKDTALRGALYLSRI